MNLKFLFLLSLLAFVFINSRQTHDTYKDSPFDIRDLSNRPIPKEKISKFEKHRRQVSAKIERPLKTVLDFEELKYPNKTAADFIKNVITSANAAIRRRVKVKSTGGILKIPKENSYCGANIKYKNQGFDGDLLILVRTPTFGISIDLKGKPCILEGSIYRPYAGVIMVDPSIFNNVKNEDFQKFVDQAIRQYLIIMAFETTLLDVISNFVEAFGSEKRIPIEKVTKTSTVKGIEKTLIITPKVVQVARKYFNCDTLEGMELDGSSLFEDKVFWDWRLLQGEVMTVPGRGSVGNILSEFTLAFLEDSGWYKVDYSTAGAIDFARGIGCDSAVSGACAPTPDRVEYCSASRQNACSRDYTSKGVCFPINSVCAVPFPKGACDDKKKENAFYSEVQGETYEAGSRCVTGIVSSGGWGLGEYVQQYCYRAACSDDKQKIFFYPRGGKPILCSKAGDNVTLEAPFYGYLICPNPLVFCNPFIDSKPMCPNNCSLSGYCNNGKCECNDGKKGSDCSGAVSPAGKCPQGCSGNGVCSSGGKCVCNAGYVGDACDSVATSPTNSCSKNCNHRGHCLNGKCVCFLGFSGATCESAKAQFKGSCPDLCMEKENRGFCEVRVSGNSKEYYCKCNLGYTKANCYGLGGKA